MVKNEKGFTIIELLAVIVLASIIIAPLMSSLVRNVTTNALMHTRRSSVSLADSAIYGFDKLSYTDLENMQIADTDNNFHLEFDSTNCDQLTLEPNDETICDMIFASTFNNISFDDAHFKVYIYDYNIGTTAKSFLTGASSPLEQEVIDIITDIPTSGDANPGLLRITVWINYSDDPYGTTVVSGLLIGDWSDSVYGD